MADNKQLPPTGTGTADIVVATDEIGGVDYQKIKLVDGTADSTTAAVVNGSGALTVADSAAETSLSVIDDWDESDRAKVNPIVGQAGVQGGAGAVSATTQRVAIATDANAISGTVTAANAAGDVAHDAVDSGNPVKIGGRVVDMEDVTIPAVGDRSDLQMDMDARVIVVAGQQSSSADGQTQTTATLGTVIDGANSGGSGALLTRSQLFNGTTWDRQRGDAANGLDVDVTRLPALAAGTNNIGDVDVLTLPGVGGLAAHAAPASGNPVYIAGRASTAVPTDVGADGDAAALWTNRNGAQVMVQAPHVGLNSDPWNLVHEGAQYTTAQTSTVLVAGGASEKIVVTQCQIQAFSTTAGTVVVYFGTGAFSRGTNRTIFDGEFKPSTTLAPGAILTGPFISGANGDDILVTTVGDIDITISCWYYVVT